MGKDFCKNCRHCIITEEDADSNDPLFPVTRTLEFVECPISTWFEQVWCIIESGFYENGGYICDLETLQPPPNCNCFEPKEAQNDANDVDYSGGRMIIAVDELPEICKECTFLWYDDESFALCSAQGSQKLMNSDDIKKRDPNCPLKKIYIDNNGLWGTVFLGKEMVEEFQKVLKKWKERNDKKEIGKQRFANPV